MSALDPSTITPQDAVAALRSYPRRFRALLAGWEEEDEEDRDAVVRRRPDPSTPSAAEQVADLRAGWEAADRDIHRMLTSDRPDLGPRASAPEAALPEEALEPLLDRLRQVAERLAATLAEVPSGDWRRTGRRHGEVRTVLDVAREAVIEGHQRLRDVERVLRAVRGKPVTPQD